MKTKTIFSKAISLLICVVMILSTLPGGLMASAFAAGCIHVHTEECLICETTEHTHIEDCYQKCRHICGEECGVVVEAQNEEPDNMIKGTLGGYTDMLTGDYMYLEQFAVTKILDGTGPFDINTDPNAPDYSGRDGNDAENDNGIVRTFDSVSYDIVYKIEKSGEYDYVETGYLCYEFTLPVDANTMYFDTGNMSWMGDPVSDLSAIPLRTSGYTLTTTASSTVLRGKTYMEPAEGNNYALPGIGTLNVIVCIGAAANGASVQPEFKAWMEHNDTENTTCPVHNRDEVKTIYPDPVTVTAQLRMNVKISQGYSLTSKIWDFTTGNNNALDKSAGSAVKGRVSNYGIVLQLYNDNPNSQLKGCEIPSGDITFDMELSSTFLPTGGTEVDANENYAPLVWSYEPNIAGGTGAVSTVDSRANTGAVTTVPSNSGGPAVNTPAGTSKCYDGGNWAATKSGNTLSFTVSGYTINPNSFPNTNYGTDPLTSTYYNPAVGVQNIGCFSAGELWVIQPFETAGGVSVLDDSSLNQGKTSGDFYISVKDSNLRATSASGEALDVVTNTSNQSVDGSDDRLHTQIALSKAGNYINFGMYAGARNHGYDWNRLHQTTPGTSVFNGKDQGTLGSTGYLLFGGYMNINGDAVNAVAAMNTLLKFDPTAFTLDGASVKDVYENYDHEKTFFFAAKPDGSAWASDAQMNAAGFTDLVYYPTLAALEADSKICVGVLAEYRPRNNDISTITESTIYYFEPTVAATIKNDDTLLGNVYQITSCSEIWTLEDFPASGVSSLVNNDPVIPTVLPASTIISNDPSTYVKATYLDGVYSGGHTGTRNIGDSLYIIPYKTAISKSVEQHKLGTTDSMGIYNLDAGQRYVDYVLYPTVKTIRQNTTGTETTLTIVDTLPDGLTYLPGSAFLGGTYKQAIKRDGNGDPVLDENGEEIVLLGRRGTVTGGVNCEPIIGTNDEGQTTLTWILYDVEVDNWEEPLRYCCKIDETAEHNEEFFNSVHITAMHDKREPKVANGNYATEQIKVSKLRAISMSKEPIKIFNDIGEDAGWVFSVGNNGANPIVDTVVMEALPYNGDAYGSDFDANLIVKSLILQNLTGEGHISNRDDWAVWYTADTKARGTGSPDYDYDQILDAVNGNTSGGVTWTQGSIDWDTGEVTVPHDQVLTAIIFTGTLNGGEILKAILKCNAKEATNSLKQNDILSNSLWQDEDGPDIATVYYVSRALEGCTWIDANQDGLRQDVETMLPGVTATLYKLKDGGTATNEADYEVVTDANGVAVSVTIGKQKDAISGAETDYVSGRYQFTNLVVGTYAVKFTNGTASISGYTASPVNVGTDEARDSDAAPTNNADSGILEKTVILGIMMELANNSMVGISQVSRDNDSGFYSVIPSLTISKTVTGNMGDREKLFDFTITLKDEDGNNISDTYTCVGGIIENSGAPTPTATQLTFTNGTAELQLKHGQKLTIQGLPNHCHYTVAETAVDGYTKLVTGDENNTDLQTDATVAYTNCANIMTPTGILLDIWPYALVVLLALGGAVTFFAICSKKKGC